MFNALLLPSMVNLFLLIMFLFNILASTSKFKSFKMITLVTITTTKVLLGVEFLMFFFLKNSQDYEKILSNHKIMFWFTVTFGDPTYIEVINYNVHQVILTFAIFCGCGWEIVKSITRNARKEKTQIVTTKYLKKYYLMDDAEAQINKKKIKRIMLKEIETKKLF